MIKHWMFAGLLLAGISSGRGAAQPIFLGPGPGPSLGEERPRTLIYMTADQMASKLRSLTGFYQPRFADFARIIGTFDPLIGARTNDRPTVVTVLLMEDLVSEIAVSVVAREIFLEPEDRLVFQGIDLSREPSEEELRRLSQDLCEEWLAQSCPVAMEDSLLEEFQAQAETDLLRAWQGYLSVFLQNGSLYYL